MQAKSRVSLGSYGSTLCAFVGVTIAAMATPTASFGQADEDVPSADSKGKRVVFTDNSRGPTALIVRDLGAERNSAITVFSRDFGSPTGKITIESLDADLMR